MAKKPVKPSIKSKPKPKTKPKDKSKTKIKERLKIPTKTFGVPSSKYIFLILVILLVVAVVKTLQYFSETSVVTTTTLPPPTITTTTTIAPTTTTTLQAKPEGKLLIALKDEEHKIPGGSTVHQMEFTLTSVEAYKGGDDEEEAGEWIELTAEPKTLDLLEYTENLAVVAEADVSEGLYERLKLGLSDGSIWITNDLFYIYNPKKYGLIVPSETTVEHTFNITAGETLTLVLDFDIEHSVSRVGIDYKLDPEISVTEQTGIPENAVTL